MRPERFQRLALATLVATLLVILWGAFVRASGSGAGCGSHWPLCNGEVVPHPKSLATVIELTHRVTSGLALILVVVQLWFAFRTFPARHPVRRGAAASMFFMVTEAGVGAGLVLFEMVAGNKSTARAYWMAAHLSNTFLLIGAMALTLWWARGKPAPRLSGGRVPVVLGLGVGLLGVGVAGAVVALGDTLFPVRTLAEGLAQDLSPGAHFLIRLRAVHPILALSVGGAILVASRTAIVRLGVDARRWAFVVNGLFLVQVAIGALNLGLLAPIPLQLTHLFVADLYWMAAVVYGATILAEDRLAEDPVAEPDVMPASSRKGAGAGA